MEIQKLSNGQIEVKHENLTLIHTNERGFKNNDCIVHERGYDELVRSSDIRFRPLFIALHNFKSQNNED